MSDRPFTPVPKPLPALKTKVNKDGSAKIASPLSRATIQLVHQRDADEHGIRRCQFPGCRDQAQGEPHHIRTRKQFGKKALDQRDDLDNLVSLCYSHHRLVQHTAGHVRVFRLFFLECGKQKLLGWKPQVKREALARDWGLEFKEAK